MVAHISPQEALLLRSLGGAGTINPRTGLPEFWDLGGGVSSGGHGDIGDGTGGSADGRGSRGDSQGGTKVAGAKQGHTTGFGFGGTMDKSQTSSHVAKSTAGGQSVAENGILGSFLGHLFDRFTQGPTTDTTTDVVNSIVGPAASQLSPGLGLGINVGAAESDTNADVANAVASGKISGTNVDTSGGTLTTHAGGLYGGVSPADIDTGRLNRDIASGAFGGGSLGGYGRQGAGGPGNADRRVLAQNAQRANAGGGLLALTDPALTLPAPTTPDGLLAYLALINAMLPGYQTNSRFGLGQVAPVNYIRTYA